MNLNVFIPFTVKTYDYVKSDCMKFEYGRIILFLESKLMLFNVLLTSVIS